MGRHTVIEASQVIHLSRMCMFLTPTALITPISHSFFSPTVILVRLLVWVREDPASDKNTLHASGWYPLAVFDMEEKRALRHFSKDWFKSVLDFLDSPFAHGLRLDFVLLCGDNGFTGACCCIKGGDSDYRCIKCFTSSCSWSHHMAYNPNWQARRYITDASVFPAKPQQAEADDKKKASTNMWETIKYLGQYNVPPFAEKDRDSRVVFAPALLHNTLNIFTEVVVPNLTVAVCLSVDTYKAAKDVFHKCGTYGELRKRVLAVMREFFQRKDRPSITGERKIDVTLNSGKRLEVIIRWFIDAYPTLKDTARWGPLSSLPVWALLVNNILYCYTVGAGGEPAENMRQHLLHPHTPRPEAHGIDVSMMQVR